jgi:hypothetical protein
MIVSFSPLVLLRLHVWSDVSLCPYQRLYCSRTLRQGRSCNTVPKCNNLNTRVSSLMFHEDLDDVEALTVRRTQLLTGLRRRTVLFHVLLFAPVVMFWIAIMASLERTPLTGRLVEAIKPVTWALTCLLDGEQSCSLQKKKRKSPLNLLMVDGTTPSQRLYPRMALL